MMCIVCYVSDMFSSSIRLLMGEECWNRAEQKNGAFVCDKWYINCSAQLYLQLSSRNEFRAMGV